VVEFQREINISKTSANFIKTRLVMGYFCNLFLGPVVLRLLVSLLLLSIVANKDRYIS